MKDGLLFKIGMSLIAAVIAALVIILAGFQAGARYGTMVSRAFVGFLLAGGLVFLVSFWIDRFGIPLYIGRHKALQQEWLSAEDAADAADVADASADAADAEEEESSLPETAAEEASGLAAATSAEENGQAVPAGDASEFKPLADGVAHMAPPQA